MTDPRQLIIDRIDAAWSEQIAHLQSLVREPSTLGNEAGVQRIMERTFRDMDLDLHVFEPDIDRLKDLPGFSPPEWDYVGRPNIVGVLPAAGAGGRSLILNGHLDVVSPEPASQWTRDPWGAEIVGDRMYGRGAQDMKSGVNAFTFAVRAIQAAGIDLNGDVILQAVIEEECTGNGTLSCLARSFTADGALIPEPFSRQALVAQVGVLWCRVVVHGSAGHVLGANRAVNAIEKTAYLIEGMRELESKLNAERHPAFKDVDWPINFNPGAVRGGDWPSTVPAECTLEFRMGFYPGMSADDAKGMVRDHLLAVAGRDDWLREHPPEITFYAFHAEGVAMEFESSPVIQTLDRVHRSVTGEPLTALVSTATTDARFFSLYHDMPVTCYGPAGANLHGIDEYVELESLREVTRVIALFILDWCGAN